MSIRDNKHPSPLTGLRALERDSPDTVRANEIREREQETLPGQRERGEHGERQRERGERKRERADETDRTLGMHVQVHR